MNELLKRHIWMFLHQNTTFIEMQSLSTIDTEMQYWLEVVHRNTAFIHCDATFEYIGHANAVFLMSSLDVVHRNKAFIVMQPLNTLDTVYV